MAQAPCTFLEEGESVFMGIVLKQKKAIRSANGFQYTEIVY
jgi:hypothetical protein